MISNEEIQLQSGHFLVRAVFKDVTGIQDVKQMSYV